jgi:hypothetical protein
MAWLGRLLCVRPVTWPAPTVGVPSVTAGSGGHPTLSYWKMAPMPDSTSTAVLVAIFGGLGAFLGAALSAVLTHRGRSEEHRREQQRADAAALGPVMAFLTDADPDRLAFNLHPDAAEQEKVMSALRERLDGIYGSVLILSAGHPSEQVGDLAGRLATATRNAFTSATWLVSVLAKRSPGKRSATRRGRITTRPASSPRIYSEK